LPTRQALLSHFHAHEENGLPLTETEDLSTSQEYLPDWYKTEYTFGEFLLDSGAYEEAEILSLRVLEEREKMLGALTLMFANQVGLTLFLQNKYGEAEKYSAVG
jgi:hypothetical protein